MSGFVHSEKVDLFISYSHVDDVPFDGDEAGWVTRLVRNIEKLLAMKLGRREFFDLWMDGRLTGNEPVTELIEGKIRDAAVFVLVLSPGYLASIWCARELEAFRAEVCLRLGELSRVFVVEFGEVERPAELSQPRGYRFWQKDSITDDVAQLGFPKLLPGDEAQYYKLITELASDLDRELRSQRKAIAQSPTSSLASSPTPSPAPSPTPSPTPSPSPAKMQVLSHDAGPTVYLADVTEDLEDLRDGVKNYLNQAGYAILPRSNYPNDLEGYTTALDADLAHAALFVQLLSELPGRKIGDDGLRQVALRLDRATRRDPAIPILQWRSRDLALQRVANEAHLKILKGEAAPGQDLEVMEVDIEEFKAAVKARLAKLLAPPPPPPPRPPDRDYFLFISADALDDGLSTELARCIDSGWSWVGYFPPRRDGDPEQARAYLEQNMKDCDGLVVVYGAAGPDWVTAQLQKARQIAAIRDRGPLKVAVYEGPPEENKNKPIGKLPRMVRVNCRHGLDQVELGRFIESLREA
jgi:TIR domain